MRTYGSIIHTRTALPHFENFVYIVSYSKPATASRMSVTESVIVAKFIASKAAEFHSCSLRGFALQRTAAAHGVPLTPSQALSVKAAMEQTEPFPTHMRARNNINY